MTPIRAAPQAPRAIAPAIAPAIARATARAIAPATTLTLVRITRGFAREAAKTRRKRAQLTRLLKPPSRLATAFEATLS
jgi:hypothetical protein